MQLSAEQLLNNNQLDLFKKKFYLIYGAEPYFIKASKDKIRDTLKNNYSLDRQVFYIESHFNWDDLYHTITTFDLFTKQKIIDLQISAATVLKKFAKNLDRLIKQFPDNNFLVISVTDKINTNITNADWFKTISDNGIIIECKTLYPGKIPAWLNIQAKILNLSLNQNDANYLISKNFGNLLAIYQELLKFKLSDNNLNIINSTNNSNYTAFDLLDFMLKANLPQTIAALNNLKLQDPSPLLIIWLLSKELREIYKIIINPDYLASLKTWPKRKQLLKQTALRLTANKIIFLLKTLAKLELAVKTSSTDNNLIWLNLTRIIKLIINTNSKNYWLFNKYSSINQ